MCYFICTCIFFLKCSVRLFLFIARSKYIVDPSVQGGGGGGGSGGYRGNFSTVTPITQQSMNLAQPFYTPNDLSFYQMPSQNSTYPSSQQNANMFIPSKHRDWNNFTCL